MNTATVLIRQVHPLFIQDGQVTSQAFCPTSKDEGKLSTYDGDQIDAESAWHHYTEELGFPSIGALGVLVSECESLDLDVSPDPEPFPEHVVIDFSHHGKNAIKSKGKKLRNIAVDRSWLYQV